MWRILYSLYETTSYIDERGIWRHPFYYRGVGRGPTIEGAAALHPVARSHRFNLKRGSTKISYGPIFIRWSQPVRYPSTSTCDSLPVVFDVPGEDLRRRCDKERERRILEKIDRGGIRNDEEKSANKNKDRCEIFVRQVPWRTPRIHHLLSPDERHSSYLRYRECEIGGAPDRDQRESIANCRPKTRLGKPIFFGAVYVYWCGLVVPRARNIDQAAKRIDEDKLKG